MLPAADLAEWADKEVPERDWMVDQYILRGQLTYFTGPGSAGKSLLAQQLGTCLALGAPFLGIPTRQTNAAYITCEDDFDELHRRQVAICKSLGASLNDLVGKFRLVSLVGHLSPGLSVYEPSTPFSLDYQAREGGMRPTKLYDAIEGIAMEDGVGFIALDNTAQMFTGNENIRNEVASFTGLLNRLAQRTKGAVVLLGHPNKAGDDYSGSTAWNNQVRSRLYLERDEHDPDLRKLTGAKANYAREGNELGFRWHDWAFVLDRDIPEDQRDALAETTKASHDNAIFLTCLEEMTKQKRAVSEKHSPSFAPSMFARMSEAKGLSKTRLEAAMDRLFRLGLIERAELWKGPDRKPVYGLRLTAGNGAGNTVRETRGTGE